MTLSSPGVNAARREQGRSINSSPPDRSTCWFQMQRESMAFTGFECGVRSRAMPMVTLFYDVIEPSGLKRAIVFRDDSSAEVFFGAAI